ncbi:endonuclease III [uncultured Desulfuromonas sp.]|uniref:endonuclease III n=1 Tax=uncultured Desulfuromonas sp. TaxID=181013 RepID=UPI002AAB1205|nr:endonuclease III [uncultured Desulfuromonas sp.]
MDNIVDNVEKIDKGKFVTKQEKKNWFNAIITVLDQHYPEAQCSLNFSNPLELVIATLLSAQTTDIRVNLVTQKLFERYRDVHAYAQADIQEVEEIIRSIGCYRVKAKHIVAAAQLLCQKFSGQVPDQLEDLIQLPGVGRKTANVVLSNAFDKPGFPVDTHVKRVARRLGWTRQSDPVKIETELCRYIEPPLWGHTSHLLIYHGREICKARSPQCERCPVEDQCKKVF